MLRDLTEDWLGRLILGIMLLVCIVTIGLVVRLVDDMFGYETQHQTEVLDKEFVPHHCTTVMTMSGSVVIPITTCYDDAWYAKTGRGTCEVPESTYNEIVTGTRGVVTGNEGYLSSEFYCHHFQPED